MSIPQPLPGGEAALAPDAAAQDAAPQKREPVKTELLAIGPVAVDPLGADWFAPETLRQPATDAERRALASALRRSR